MGKRKQVTVPAEKIKEQDKYIEHIRFVNEQDYLKTGRKKKVLIQTFGCAMVYANMKKRLVKY